MRIEMKPGDSLTIAFVDDDGNSVISAEVDVDFDSGQEEVVVSAADGPRAVTSGVLLRVPVPGNARVS